MYIQSGKHLHVTRHNKVISRINHIIYNMPKSLNMSWRSSWPLHANFIPNNQRCRTKLLKVDIAS